MLIVLALTFLAEPSLRYSGPKDRKTAPVEQFQPHRWSKGTTLFAVSPEIHLRAQPRLDAEIVAKLPMGAEVKLLSEPGEPSRAAGRVDFWYRVASEGHRGFLHGSTLTPFHLAWNGKRATVAWGPSYQILVRLSNGSQLETLRLDPGGQAYVCCGGVLEARWIDAKRAGAPMVEIHSTVEACGDSSTHYVELSGRKPRLVLETGGLHDPPSYAESRVEFRASPRIARVSLVTYTLGDDGEEELCKTETITPHRWDGTRYVAGPPEPTQKLSPCPEDG